MTDEKRKYWLKLDKDFLKNPQMRIIKTMPNGKDYIIFYLALMLESIETVGHLRFTSLIPYNADMLATITDTNPDIVKMAIKCFCELGLMQIFDDGTIFMTEVPNMTGKESDSAERVREHRQRLKEIKLLQCNTEVTKCNDNIYINKDKEINKDIYKDKEKTKKFIIPTIEEIEAYCIERNNTIDASQFFDYYTSKGWMIGKNKMKDWKAAIRNWERAQDGKKKQATNTIQQPMSTAELLEQMRKERANWT